MQTFQSNPTLFWKALLKEWLCTIFTILPLIVLIQVFIYDVPIHKISFPLFMLFLFLFFNTITRFVVKEIRLDTNRGKLIIEIKSFFSGEKTKEYDLEGIKTTIKQASTYKKLFRTPFCLIIYINKKTAYHIRTNYGFEKETLMAFDHALKSLPTRPRYLYQHGL